MPSVSTSFLYSFVTMMMVGTILTFTLASYVSPLKEISEVNKLKEILDQVESKTEEDLAIIAESNATLNTVIQLPPRIGDRDYWIRFSNDSSKAWIEGAFGRVEETGAQRYRVYLPSKVTASGAFEGRYVLALLNCSLDKSTPKLVLSRQE